MQAAAGDRRRTLLEYTDSIACDIHNIRGILMASAGCSRWRLRKDTVVMIPSHVMSFDGEDPVAICIRIQRI